MSKYETATQPTMYFIGVTTGSSSIMKVFPKWAKALNLKDAVIKGMDFAPHSDPALYREAVGFIKNDPYSMGALVTTHKIDLYNACKDMFDYLDPFARQLGEISSISKRDGKLCGHAKDPISSGLALENFVPADHWKKTDGEVLIMGAGGSALAMSVYLTQEKFGENIPKHIIITNRSQPRLDKAKKILDGVSPKTKFDFILCPEPKDNDRVMEALKPGSLVVNATGLGKDGPGSPLTNDGQFPKDGIVWELNYRGERLFLTQAENQQKEKNLIVEAGWIYFIHGWTQVIAEVFHLTNEQMDIPKLSEIASAK